MPSNNSRRATIKPKHPIADTQVSPLAKAIRCVQGKGLRLCLPDAVARRGRLLDHLPHIGVGTRTQALPDLVQPFALPGA